MPQHQQQNTQNQQSSNSQNTEQGEHDDLQETMGNAAIQEMLNTQNIDPDSIFARPYMENQARNSQIKITLSSAQMRNVQLFQAHWEKHQSRYQSVAAKANMPAKLIAALHWRESTGNFNTYLHQGDPLGRPAVNWPNNIPVFHKWEDAAVHALNMKRYNQNELNLTQNSTNIDSIATYAESYNGLGYHNRNKPSPYVYSGSSAYVAGKYVADGRYDSQHVDQQVGVVPLMGSINGLTSSNDLSPREITKEDLWDRVVSGQKILKRGAHGREVTVMQEHLKDLGYLESVDGDFGPGTERAIIDFQKDHELSPDAVVGPGTASAIMRALQNNQTRQQQGDTVIQ